MKKTEKDILLVLPMAYRDGIDKYDGVMRFLKRNRMAMNLQLIRDPIGAEELRARLDDGLDAVLADALFFTPDALAELSRSGLPAVLFNPPSPDPFDADRGNIAYVSLDSAEIGRRAAEYLREQGDYSSFAYVNDRRLPAWSLAREKSFRETLSRHGIEVRSYRSPTPERTFNAEARENLRNWLKELPKPAAVFVSHDPRAGEVLHLAGGTGLRVPDDLAVLGVDDDTMICLRTDPPLSSIRPDCELAGHLAMELLAKMLAGKAVPRKSVVPVKEIVGRRSTAPSSYSGKLVEAASEMIATHACDIASVGEIAARLHVSRRLLDLRFREIKGTSVLEALIAVRLENVKALLDSTTLSIGEITELCHFRTETYLKRLFKARFGLTMRDYRRRM